MGLTGIQIFKLLPKKNCKECGDPTCLAFAMKLAQGKAELSQCPYVSEEAKAQLAEASAPPIRGVVLGTGEEQLKVGEELVLFRHEKTFINPAAIGVLFKDTEDDAAIDEKLKNFNEISFERVGYILKAHLAAVKNESGDADKFVALVNKIKDNTKKPIMIMSDNADALEKAAPALKGLKGVICAATADTLDKLVEVAKANECSLVIKAPIDEIEALTKKAVDAGLKDLILDTEARDVKTMFQHNTFVRRAALKKKNKEVGFPILNLPCEMTDDPIKETTIAALGIAKYGSIVVISDAKPEILLPLGIQRLNIYTDPQRPMVVEEGIYPINEPDENSPVIVTTNFALTYFIVSAVVEASRVPTWLVIMDVEGMSVLTAWSAGKFVADAIAPFIKKVGIADKINHRQVIIPGYVAQISGELQEELGEEWEVVIGTREAADLPAFLKDKYGK
jgi:acetyl-CoA decarbonylase/synthase complex subunit gamma